MSEREAIDVYHRMVDSLRAELTRLRATISSAHEKLLDLGPCDDEKTGEICARCILGKVLKK